MPVYKCKMCGGSLEINANESTATCEYCGATQTIPKTDDDIIGNLFNRANTLRLKSEFDKAEEIYNKIITTDNTQAEAYWGIILCKYGIEYVEDPATFKRVPTCHRTSFEAITADEDYKLALQYADTTQKVLYEEEAKAIDEIQKGILAISQNEKPYDVFICYKETDENGKRTNDSVIANDIYHQLTQEGFKVFYAAITLEDKLGQEYEPYIFAALNSAKVMLVIGSKPEYFNAVWVKNEWSRFMKLMKSDRSKLLIPCFKDMDAYELPEEFAHLQAQDMSKIGFINDVVRGIKKVTSQKEEIPPDSKNLTTQQTTLVNISPLLKRAFMSLDDEEWDKADDFCEQVLNQEPECAEAYLGKLMAEIKCRKREKLKDCSVPFDGKKNFEKAIRFGNEELKKELIDTVEYIKERNETARKTKIYNDACGKMNSAKSEDDFETAADIFKSISGFRDSDEMTKKCSKKAEEAIKEGIYESAHKLSYSKNIETLTKSIKEFQSISGYKDSDELAQKCNEQIKKIVEENEKRRIEDELRVKKRKRIAIIISGVTILITAFIFLTFVYIIPTSIYNNAVSLMNDRKYVDALEILYNIPENQNAKNLIIECLNKYPKDKIMAGNYNTVAIKSGGTIVATGKNGDGQCNLSDWKDIVAVSAGEYHTVGLKANGTVIATGWNKNKQCDVSEWDDIVAVSAGGYHTVGLKSNGTVVAIGSNNSGQCNVSEWKDIVAISAGYSHTIGLKSDGTVVATGSNKDGQCDVSEWKNIIAVSAGGSHTVGLKSDGTVIAIGHNYFGECIVSKWENIVAISAGYYHTVGLKADGTVVASGERKLDRCDVTEWSDIVAISAGYAHTVGLKSDGTVVSVGYNASGECNVSDWKDIKTTND